MKRKYKNYKHNKKVVNKYIFIVAFFLVVSLSYFSLNNIFYLEKYFRDFFFLPAKLINNKQEISIHLEKELEEENIELKKLLDIRGSLLEYDIIYATVIERNTSYWLNSLTINKGEKDKIESGMAVIDYDGLVGLIDKTSYNTATVKLITSSDKYNVTSVKIKSNDDVNKIMRVSNNKLIIEGINKKLNIEVGAQVVTNGLSSKFPSGIKIGQISSIENDSCAVSRVATITPSANLHNIRFVAVLKRKI